jgi:hypothetical protein
MGKYRTSYDAYRLRVFCLVHRAAHQRGLELQIELDGANAVTDFSEDAVAILWLCGLHESRGTKSALWLHIGYTPSCRTCNATTCPLIVHCRLVSTHLCTWRLLFPNDKRMVTIYTSVECISHAFTNCQLKTSVCHTWAFMTSNVSNKSVSLPSSTLAINTNSPATPLARNVCHT